MPQKRQRQKTREAISLSATRTQFLGTVTALTAPQPVALPPPRPAPPARPLPSMPAYQSRSVLRLHVDVITGKC